MLKASKSAYFIVCIGFLISFGGLAQVPFAQVNQSPLLLNPSLAGGKNKHQISLAYNATSDNQKNQYKNQYASYDQFSKKLKSGIGFYYSYSQKSVDTIDSKIMNDLPNKVLSETYQQHSSQFSVGFCIAPKLNVLDKANPNIIRYTFSPSFFLEYNRGSFQVNNNFDSRSYYTTTYNVENPNGSQSKSVSTITQFFHNSISYQRIKTGFGLQLNSKNSILLASVKYETGFVNEIPQYIAYQLPSFQTTIRKEELSYQLFSLEENVTVGMSFPLKEKSKIHFTPIVGIGFKQYLNAPTSFRNQVGYLNLLESNRPLDFNYTHSSANFKFKKLLFGAAYTRSYLDSYYGGGIGFQNDSIKIMSNWVFGKRQFQEITLSYLI